MVQVTTPITKAFSKLLDDFKSVQNVSVMYVIENENLDFLRSNGN